MISWVGLQQPGLSWAWETDVGASALPPGPMESSEAAEKCSVCPVCVYWSKCFHVSLISHLLCLDYYFGRKQAYRRCINICSQFALWLHAYIIALCLDV